MKATEIISLLKKDAAMPPKTCDGVKVGDADSPVTHIGVTLTATIDTVKKAKEAGCDFLIVHEPTFYTHFEEWRENALIEEKTRLLTEAGITLYRHHDGMHSREKDSITAGVLATIGLVGRLEKTKFPGSALFHLDTPMTMEALTERLKDRLSLQRLRVAGKTDGSVRCIALCFGMPEGVFALLQREDVDCVLVGEVYEWQLGEYARDAAACGKQKSLVAMEHIASERAGMKVLADELKALFPDIPVTYFETESVYTVV